MWAWITITKLINRDSLLVLASLRCKPIKFDCSIPLQTMCTWQCNMFWSTWVLSSEWFPSILPPEGIEPSTSSPRNPCRNSCWNDVGISLNAGNVATSPYSGLRSSHSWGSNAIDILSSARRAAPTRTEHQRAPSHGLFPWILLLLSL